MSLQLIKYHRDMELLVEDIFDIIREKILNT